MIKAPYDLSPDELGLLSNLVHSPVFGVLKKIVDQDLKVIQSMILTEKDVDVIRQLQGRAAGLGVLANVPVVLTKIHDEKIKKANIEAAKKPHS